MGEQSLLIQCGNYLLERGHEIVGVIANDDQIQKWTRERELTQWSPTDDYVPRLRDREFDYFFSIANLRIVPAPVLDAPRRGAINFHDGPLPERAGMYVPAWSIIEQHDEHGVTWHEMTAEVDEGDILVQRRFPIASDDTVFTLNTKCYEAGIESFEELIGGLEQETLSPQAQDLSSQTYYARDKRPARAGVLDWNMSAQSLSARVRGLTFGPALNPLGTPKIHLGDAVYRVNSLDVLATASEKAPGTLLEVGPDRLMVSTSTEDVSIPSLSSLTGTAVDLESVASEHSLRVGERLPRLDDETAARLRNVQSAVAQDESFWRTQLQRARPLDLPYVTPADGPADVRTSSVDAQSIEGATDLDPDTLGAYWIAFLARLTQSRTVTVGLRHASLDEAVQGLDTFYASTVPCTLDVDLDASPAAALAHIQERLATTKERGTYAHDIFVRTPALSENAERSRFNVEVVLSEAADPSPSLPHGVALSMQPSSSGTVHWAYDATRLSSDHFKQLQAQFERFLTSALAETEPSLQHLPILSEETIHTLLEDWNDTERSYDPTPIHHQFEAQAERTPDATAATYRNDTLSYRRLDERANQMARHLIDMGVEPGDLVGVCVERSLNMIVSLLGIWKAGAAYVPLDPSYPADRIAFMVADAELACVISHSTFTHLLDASESPLLLLDEEADALSARSTAPPNREASPDHTAYVIYTSGSTGKPKGVVVTHRNLANFFAGMDDRIPRSDDRDDVWLAVTSISFDISVLELFWTLTRGFHVVLHTSDRTRAEHPAADPSSHAQNGTSTPRPALDQPVDFSLFYFSSDEKLDDSGGASDKYRLLLEGAEFGDTHGFEAIWTPERHFHDFGGLYPNPSVISAAIAARTESIGIRAGSCVSPLHHPVRIAEDWAVVDNLSNGRVGISFAAGWQPDDFVIQPDNYADRKELMFEQIEQVKALWRGEDRTFDGPDGPVTVRTLPRAVQSELPVWVTAAGNPETFEQAGAGGYNMLTHLLGQTVDELEEKIAIYRRARNEAGHPGEGTVTLMLHSFVGDSEEAVRSIVREPMKSYLRSSIGLIKKAAWSFPTFKQKTTNEAGDFSLDELSDDEMDAVLEHAFERYYATSGLFGTPEQCLERVAEVAAVGVNEIACLLDFGIDAQTVLDHLPALATVKDRADDLVDDSHRTNGRSAAAPPVTDDSLPAQIRRHDVTHLQCTPSQARMLVGDADSRDALDRVFHMMVGGETLPPALARELTEVVGGSVCNMYGPTETTIWSSTWPVENVDGPVSIGTPIANTTFYVLDEARELVPIGAPGELWIGGDGVTNGYLHRETLTAERFVDNPFHDGQMYRTGDLVRYRDDGTLDFLGRVDFQVKIRGHRIELGEIEAALERQDGVRAAVANVYTNDDDDQRLVAYLQPEEDHSVDPEAIREGVARVLPNVMVPSHFTTVETFPLTPNGKVDRNALPDPRPPRAVQTDSFDAPTDEIEELVSTVWKRVLDLDHIGVNENFFDLGGHSLLAVQVVRQLSDEMNREIPIVDLFQFPTIRSLADHLDTDADTAEGATRGTSRAERRRQAFTRR